MAIYTRDSGAWRLVKQPAVKIGAAWKDIEAVYVREAGTWRLHYKKTFVVAMPMNGTDIAITSSFDPAGTAHASISWFTTGQARSSSGFGPPSEYQWLVSGSLGDYQIHFTQSSGAAVAGSALNAWHSLSSARSLSLSVSATGYSASASAAGNYQIRRASNGEIVGNENWSLSASVEYAAG